MRLTVLEVLEAAREAAVEIRRFEEQAEIRRQLIGVQGHNSFEVHAKTGILDPMRHVIELMDWQQESEEDVLELRDPIDEAYELVAGAETVTDSLSIEVITRYYLQAESWNSIARDLGDRRHVEPLVGMDRKSQVSLLERALAAVVRDLETIGIARLKEMGRETE